MKLSDANSITLIYMLLCGQRDSLSAQLDLTVTKAESEQLARALQEEQYFELSQENKKAVTRHKQELGEKESTIARVSMILCNNTVIQFFFVKYNISFSFFFAA